MPTAAGDAHGTVSARVMRRWEALDPLLPVPFSPPGCGAELIVAGAGADPAAIGTCEHWEGAPGSLDLTWGAARQFRLTAWPAGPGIADGLDELLSQWREHLVGLPGASGEDTAGAVTWPSRDIDGVGTMLRHGLAPLTVIAARPAGRHPAWSAGDAAQRADAATWDAGTAAELARRDLRIRRAGPADLDAVVRLGMVVIRYDAHFGGVIERPETAAALRCQAAGRLAGPDAWIWLAERHGAPVGMLYAERPESAGWIAPMARQGPVAYLDLMVVLPGERGRGVGAALVARLHREVDAVGVAVTLLHYAQLNPLGGPFWSQAGYRPLWNVWEARPARAIR